MANTDIWETTQKPCQIPRCQHSAVQRQVSRIVLTKWGLVTDILKEDVQGLQQLNAHIAAWFLPQDVQEENKHILLQEEAGERMGKRQWFVSTERNTNHPLVPCLAHVHSQAPKSICRAARPCHLHSLSFQANAIFPAIFSEGKNSADSGSSELLNFWQNDKDLYLLNDYIVICVWNLVSKYLISFLLIKPLSFAPHVFES